MLSYTNAVNHLNGLINLLVEENKFLSCVRTYAINAQFDVIGDVRADGLTPEKIRTILDLQTKARRAYTKFMEA